MLAASVAQIRLAFSLMTGRPVPDWALDRLIAAARETVREFGEVGADGAQLVNGPTLDIATRREIHLRRFRHQARRAADGTAYYARWFGDDATAPSNLTWDDISGLPLTSKQALRDDPDAFVRRDIRPVLRSTTTGTTGRPTQVSFSATELRMMTRFSALGSLMGNRIRPDDVVINAMSSRASLGNLSLSAACEHIGALLQPVGIIDPRLTLSLLAQPLRLTGRAPKASVLCTYPSYLGELVEHGLLLGYRPDDFGLRRITVGGEVVTSCLLRRARHLFGDQVVIETGYAMTETYPFAGMPCSQGHLHFEPSHGLVEVIDPVTGAACRPGQVGNLVVTPFAPYRDTTLLLRYDTQDVVRAVGAELDCEHRHLPATSALLGKLPLAIRHDHGWTYPAEVLSALEDVDAVPLPARFGYWAEDGGVALDVVVRSVTDDARRRIEDSLGANGVPVTAVRLVTESGKIRHPFPLRCDLRETGFHRSGGAFVTGEGERP